jgi:hypothetical protein
MVSFLVLSVRSFLRWLVRSGTEPRIDVNRKVQERENAPLHAGEGRQMIPPPAPFPDDRQGESLKAFQHALARRAGRRPRRGPGIQPCQPRPCRGQTTADAQLQPRQHPQPEGPQADQPGRLVISLQRHGRQRQRPAFQAAHRPFDQRLVAVRQDGLRQRELLSRLGGDLHPPTPLAPGRGPGLLVEADGDLDVPLQLPGGFPAAIAPPRAFPEAFLIPDVPQAWHPSAAQEGVHRLPQGTRVGAPGLPAAPRLERRHRRLGLGQPGAQPPLAGLSPWARTHAHAPLQPAVRLPRHLRGHAFPSLNPLRDLRGWAAQWRTMQPGQRLRARPPRSQVASPDGWWQLDRRQRAPVVVPPAWLDARVARAPL